MPRSTFRSRLVHLLLLGACGPAKPTESSDSGDPGSSSGFGSSSTSGTISSSGTGGLATEAATPTTDLGSTTAIPSELCPDHPTPDDCCCFEDIRDGTSNAGTSTVCGANELCPLLAFVCANGPVDDCPIENLSTQTEDAISCALSALANGETGRFYWVVDDVNLGFSQSHIIIDLVGDGTAFRHGSSYVDGTVSVEPLLRVTLPALEMASGCLANADWRLQFDCLRKAVGGEPLNSCLDGYTFSPEG